MRRTQPQLRGPHYGGLHHITVATKALLIAFALTRNGASSQANAFVSPRPVPGGRTTECARPSVRRIVEHVSTPEPLRAHGKNRGPNAAVNFPAPVKSTSTLLGSGAFATHHELSDIVTRGNALRRPRNLTSERSISIFIARRIRSTPRRSHSSTSLRMATLWAAIIAFRSVPTATGHSVCPGCG